MQDQVTQANAVSIDDIHRALVSLVESGEIESVPSELLADETFDSLGVGSMAMVSLVVALEEQLRCEFELDEEMQIDCVADLLASLRPLV